MPDPAKSGFDGLLARPKRRGWLMIMCAPSGARRQKADHSAIPLTPAELATESRTLLDAGVSVLHLHVRDAAGQHTLSPASYRQATDAIRRAVGDELVIQVTTESVGRYSPDQQMAMVRELRPEAVSLALSEVCPDRSHEPAAAKFYAWLAHRGVWAQHIVYSPAEFRRLDRLREAGMLGVARPSCLFVIGSYKERRSGSADELRGFLEAADAAQFDWSACCFGPTEQAVMRAVCAAGGHVRLGFENNLALPDGQLARDNAELIRAFRAALPDPGPEPAGATRVRAECFPPGRSTSD
jgi:uncharacterized protein (DUF849 family)